jgi:hypothetical protein
VAKGSSIIPLIELDQYLASADALVIHHQHLLDEGVDVRRERSDVPADIGVVGAFDAHQTQAYLHDGNEASTVKRQDVATKRGAVHHEFIGQSIDRHRL